jgi:hypothetical protein
VLAKGRVFDMPDLKQVIEGKIKGGIEVKGRKGRYGKLLHDFKDRRAEAALAVRGT